MGKKKFCKLYHHVCLLSCFSHVQLCSPIDCSLPGYSVCWIFQARILEGLPFPSSGYLPDPGIKPTFLMSPALVGGFFTTNATWKAPVIIYYFNILEYALIGVVFF